MLAVTRKKCLIPISLFSSEDNSDNLEDAYTSTDFLGTEKNNFIHSQYAGQLVTKQAKCYKKKRKQIAPTSNSKSKKCHICGEKIGSRRSYHMQKFHPGQKSFPCKMCDKAFDIYRELQNHKKTHLLIVDYTCDLCNSKLKSLQSISRHIKSHGGEKPYVCHVCGQSFRHKTSLSKCKHGLFAAAVSNDIGCVCKMCGKVFASMDHMNKHTQDQSCRSSVERIKTEAERETQFSCNICNKSFAKQWLLKQHMNVHTGEKPFKCEFCYRKFHSSKAKGAHKYLKHSGTFQGFKCKICGEKCKSGLGREAHYLTHTKEELQSYNIVIKMAECDVCGKIVRKNYLTNHKLSHSSKDSFICEICGTGFKRAGNLKKHSFIHMKPHERPVMKARLPNSNHAKDKKHICNVCGRAFSIKFQLILHNRIHTGERPHRCEVCGKSFITPQGLKVHEVVHTKIKAFKCNICGDAFSLQTNLKRHYAIHTGERPFQCDYCGKSFPQKVHLVCHRRIHTGEKPYQCSSCGKKFSDPSTVHKHKTRHEKV